MAGSEDESGFKNSRNYKNYSRTAGLSDMPCSIGIGSKCLAEVSLSDSLSSVEKCHRGPCSCRLVWLIIGIQNYGAKSSSLQPRAEEQNQDEKGKKGGKVAGVVVLCAKVLLTGSSECESGS